MGNSELKLPGIEKLRLKRLQSCKEAGVAICSLPVPEGFEHSLSFLKGEVMPTSISKLGCWPMGKTPRRLLMTADLSNDAPETLEVAEGRISGSLPPLEISMEVFETCTDPAFMWERHVAKITYCQKSLGLVMGLNTGGSTHWWEACKLQVLSQDDFCLTVEIGGAIPLVIYDSSPEMTNKYYDHPYRHKHNWLYGRIFARLYSNGVCEIYAHHINNKFFDDGRDLPDCVPVIGFKVYDAKIPTELCGKWNGDRDRIRIGHAELDISNAKSLATPKQPGNFYVDETFGFFVWQPYLGAELYGGKQPFERTGDGYIYRAEERLFPRGFARTVRFSFSLSGRSPVIARYLPPAWWYGVCKEFMHDDLLPVSNCYDGIMELGREYLREYIVNGGFEDGSVARYGNFIEDGSGRHDPSWEGELPHALLLRAWRSGDVEEYEDAIRAVYTFDDIYLDHASNIIRMHGWAPPAASLPMMRANGIISGYLETGDRVLREDAMGIIDNAFRIHRNSWPRMCIGRDACFIRGAVMYYRYFNDEHYRELARDAINDVILTQCPDGAFGDQGGGSGTHQRAGYIVKPWMGCMAVGGLIDYLELFPDDEAVFACVKRFGDFLLKERHYHAGCRPEDAGEEGFKASSSRKWACGLGWSYQHYFRNGTRFKLNGVWVDLKSPYQDLWHQEYLARVLAFCSIKTGNPAYFDAWAESAEAYYGVHDKFTSDHDAIQALQFIQWTQAKLVNARLGTEGITCKPCDFGARTPKTAAVMAPEESIQIQI